MESAKFFEIKTRGEKKLVKVFFERSGERAEEATVKSGGEPLSELICSGAGGSHRKRPGVVPCL